MQFSFYISRQIRLVTLTWSLAKVSVSYGLSSNTSRELVGAAVRLLGKIVSRKGIELNKEASRLYQLYLEYG